MATTHSTEIPSSTPLRTLLVEAKDALEAAIPLLEEGDLESVAKIGHRVAAIGMDIVATAGTDTPA